MLRDQPILLVEDNPDDVELTLRSLRENGIHNQVVVAKDGVEALELLHGSGPEPTPPPLPAVVLLDLNLPKVDGIEVLRRIREHPRTRLLPVVVLTSSNEERDVVTSYGLGANSFVRKPVDFDEFHRAARQLSLYWLVLNEPPPHTGG